MLRSFLILLLVCAAHSSLAENDKLYKRMEVQDTVNLGRKAIKSASGASSSGVKPEDHGLTSPLQAESSSGREKIAFREEMGQPSQPNSGHSDPNNGAPNPHNSPTADELNQMRENPPLATVSKQNFFKRIQQKISMFFDSIAWHLRNLPRKKLYTTSSTPRRFDEPFKGLDGFKAITDDRQIPQMLESITTDILSKKYLRNAYLTEKTDPSRLLDNLQQNLIEIRKFNEEFKQAQIAIDSNTQRINENLIPLLANKYNKREDLSKLGRQLSQYKLKNLESDRKMVEDTMNVNDKHLSNVLGFLGPGNVLAPEVKAILEEGFEAKKWVAARGASADSIVADIIKLQTLVSKYTQWQRRATMDIKFKGSYENLDLMVLSEIQNVERSLAQKLVGPTTYQGIIKDIQKSEMYRSFERELLSPKSDAAYELQLIEPWGYSRKLEEMNIRDLPVRSLNALVPRLEVWEKLKAQTPLAYESTRTRLELTRKAQMIKDQLSRTLSPEGMRYVAREIEKRVSSSTPR